MMNREYMKQTYADNLAAWREYRTAEALMNLPEEPHPTEPTETETTAEAKQNEEENTMKNAQNVLNSIQNAAQKVIAYRAEFIRKEAQTAADIRDKWNLRDYCTPKQFDRLAAMQDAEPIPAADLDKMTAKAARKIERDAVKASDKVQTVAQLDAPEFIRLYITWTRSAVWGWNPHCSLTAWSKGADGYRDENTFGRASGCGYDKTSAACSEALNASDLVRGALVRFVNDGGENYGVYTADSLHFPVCPYFEGGCGMSTITETLRKMGYKVTDTTHYNRRGTEECRIIEASREV